MSYKLVELREGKMTYATMSSYDLFASDVVDFEDAYVRFF
jgi:hypothetical protein